MLEAGHRQNHYLTKDNVENKQVDKTEELSETRNHSNPAIRPHRRRRLHDIYLCRKSNIPDRKVLSEPQYRPV